MVKEVWKDIPGYKGKYQVSNRGRVRNAARVILKGNKNSKGYQRHELKDSQSRRKNHMTARLVLTAFKGYPLRSDYHADHKDGDITNNCITNLRWLSPHKNQIVKVKRRRGAVCGTKTGKSYIVTVRKAGKVHYAGAHRTKRAAKAAYKAKCKELGVK